MCNGQSEKVHHVVVVSQITILLYPHVEDILARKLKTNRLLEILRQSGIGDIAS